MSRVPLILIGACFLTCLSAPALAQLPDPTGLFACPLETSASGYEARAQWPRQAIEFPDTLRLDLATPAGWELRREGASWLLESKSGRTLVRVRYHRGEEANTLHWVRQRAEAMALGPPWSSPSCEARIRNVLREQLGRQAIEVGVYARVLGERRRHFALFIASPGGGVIEVIIRMRWRSRAAGPDLDIVRRIFGSLRLSHP